MAAANRPTLEPLEYARPVRREPEGCLSTLMILGGSIAGLLGLLWLCAALVGLAGRMSGNRDLDEIDIPFFLVLGSIASAFSFYALRRSVRQTAQQRSTFSGPGNAARWATAKKWVGTSCPLRPARRIDPVSPYMPILLDLTGRHVVIVGGGAVAARKAASLAARVTVVAPKLTGDFSGAVTIRTKSYDPTDLADADLVFAATDSPDVNDAVVRDCRKQKIWCNRVDDGGDLPGDFAASARFDRGPVTVTVNAGSAALSAAIRDKLAEKFDPAWADMAAAMTALRPVIRDRSGLDPAARRETFRRLVTDEAFAVLSASGVDGLKRWLFEGNSQ
jgi:precorrin-2 dehydrogenase/sirohydrochlorin ferrochelatase